MTQSTELLPCPFCGASGHRLTQAQIFADVVNIWSVECLDCGAERASDESQAEADQLWNTRVEHSTPDRNAVLEEAAKIAETLFAGKNEADRRCGHDIAAAIRALTTTPEPTDTHPELVGDVEAKVLAYNHAHLDAVEMGYPSLTEALEHLSELRSPEPTDPAGVSGDGEAIARLFHDTYERLAPSFGYETRADTKAFDPDSPNGKLMIAVCGEVAASIRPSPVLEVAKEALEYTLESLGNPVPISRRRVARKIRAALQAIKEGEER